MAEPKFQYGPSRAIGPYQARAQIIPSGVTVVRLRRRQDGAEIAFSIAPADAEQIAAVLTAAARDARALGGGDER